jgi:hypothetical protein
MRKALNANIKISLCAIVIAIIIILFCKSNGVEGGARVELDYTDEPIPKNHFKTWSLFLISNPEWVLPESESKIKKLYQRYKVFGNAIGPDHLAVWFWISRQGQYRLNSQTYVGDKYIKNLKNIDVFRSSAFCKKLNLIPSEGPYIVITDEYPGEGLIQDYSTFNKLENYSIIELNDLTPPEITNILSKLADQLVLEGIYKFDPKKEKFWRILEKSYEVIRTELVGLSTRVTLSIDTIFFKIKISPKPNE